MPETLEVDEGVALLLNRSLKLEGFFPEFKAEHAKMLFTHSGLYAYDKGAPVLSEGTVGRDLYILQEGRVEVRDIKGNVLASLKDGELFGEMALLKDGIRHASVIAVEKSSIYRLAYQDMQYLLKNNEELGSHLETLAKARLK